MQETLHIGLVQANLVWQNPAANFAHIAQLLQQNIPKQSIDIIILPEMFATGFTMQPQQHALPSSQVIHYMHTQAIVYQCLVIGSAAVVDTNKYYNRLFAVLPDGTYHTYDKRHLFAMAGEQNHYTAGTQRLIFEYKGWRIMPQICYDVRFAMWQHNPKKNPYDLLIMVANFPKKRINAWHTLLPARAIENQCYVAATNRVGYDGNDIYHNGASMLIDPMGSILHQFFDDEGVFMCQISKNNLNTVRKNFPFLQDADDF
jgi:predicted amidohydrolase